MGTVETGAVQLSSLEEASLVAKVDAIVPGASASVSNCDNVFQSDRVEIATPATDRHFVEMNVACWDAASYQQASGVRAAYLEAATIYQTAGREDGGSGAAIVTNDTTSLHFTRESGFAPTNDGSAPYSCRAATAAIDVDLITHSLTYSLCSATPTANLVGTVQLSDGDFQAVIAEARTMRMLDVENCGADFEVTSVAASSEGGAGATYLNFTCNNASATVTNLDAMMDQLIRLIPAACPWLSSCT